MTSLTSPFHYPGQSDRFREEPFRIVHGGYFLWEFGWNCWGRSTMFWGAYRTGRLELGIARGNLAPSGEKLPEKQHNMEHQRTEGWKDTGVW